MTDTFDRAPRQSLPGDAIQRAAIARMIRVDHAGEQRDDDEQHQHNRGERPGHGMNE